MALDVTLGSAFLAGLVSFVSPCVLPIVPPSLCFLAGVSLDELTQGGEQVGSGLSRRVLKSAAAFVLGFTTVFVGFGATASVIGRTLAWHRDTLSVVSGIII